MPGLPDLSKVTGKLPSRTTGRQYVCGMGRRLHQAGWLLCRTEQKAQRYRFEAIQRRHPAIGQAHGAEHLGLRKRIMGLGSATIRPSLANLIRYQAKYGIRPLLRE